MKNLVGINNMYTTLKIAKQLKEWGCELESEMYWDIVIDENNVEPEIVRCYKTPKNKKGHYGKDAMSGKDYGSWEEKYYPAYDILNDICAKYAKEFFGKATKNFVPIKYHCLNIFFLIQDGKQKEAEEYILEHCLFNPKNK